MYSCFCLLLSHVAIYNQQLSDRFQTVILVIHEKINYKLLGYLILKISIEKKDFSFYVPLYPLVQRLR